MRVREDPYEEDFKEPIPDGLTDTEEASWKYQHFIKDYLRCVASIDDNMGRLLDTLDEEGLTPNTLVAYTSDQGFFLVGHGWNDTRFMYEQSLRMPLLIRYPPEVAPGSATGSMVVNVDLAPTFLDVAGVAAQARVQGRSGLPGTSQRTMRPEWELFDLQADPHELRSLHNDPAYATVFARLRTELEQLQRQVGDQPHPADQTTGS
jgi:arylsulfatase A-like enzyme